MGQEIGRKLAKINIFVVFLGEKERSALCARIALWNTTGNRQKNK